MRLSTTFRAGSVAMVFALALATSACSSDSDADSDPAVTPGPESELAQAPDQSIEPEAAPEEVLDVLDDALAGPDADGDDDRAFGATEDMVIQVVEQTFSSDNAKAELKDGALRVTMDGSAEDMTASTPCLALESLLADGEEAFIVYSDGEIACADRFNRD